MKLFAHIVEGIVREVFEIPDGLIFGKDLYSAGIANESVACDDTVAVGMLYDAKTGKFMAPPVAPPTIPVSVTKAQAKIQLLRTPGASSGKTLLDDVTAAVEAAGGEVAIWFADAQTWERANPYVANLSSGLKLTSDQVDELFIEAAKIAA